MMIILHPTYTLRVEIQDRPGELSEALTMTTGVRKLHKYADIMNNKTGCDEVLVAVKKAISDAGIEHACVSLEKFEHRA